MVVQYPCGSEGSVFSFFTITPYVLFWRTGSCFSGIILQAFLSGCVACLAMYLDSIGENPVHGMSSLGFQMLGYLLAFLLVFKTQNSYNQFWEGLGHVDALVKDARQAAMGACTLFNWKKDGVQDRSRRLTRYMGLYYFAAVEYLIRSGPNKTNEKHIQDQVREDVRILATQEELQMLYPGEPPATKGSDSKYSYTNPYTVLMWAQLNLGKVVEAEAVSPPVAAGILNSLGGLMEHFFDMDKIDKTQFPLPYAQLVKWLMVIYCFTIPFFVVSVAKEATIMITVIPTVGFFGLDEVSEILESPFGRDPNDIDLRQYGVNLVRDLEITYQSRANNMEERIKEEGELLYHQQLEANVPKRSLVHKMQRSSWHTRERMPSIVVNPSLLGNTE